MLPVNKTYKQTCKQHVKNTYKQNKPVYNQGVFNKAKKEKNPKTLNKLSARGVFWTTTTPNFVRLLTCYKN